MRLQPQRTRCWKRINTYLLPPSGFITMTMELTVVSPAQWHHELIAHLATERTRLRKTQMMRIRRTPTANQAGLFDDMPDMAAVTNASRFGEFKAPLIDLRCPGLGGHTLVAGSLCVLCRHLR